MKFRNFGLLYVLLCVSGVVSGAHAKGDKIIEKIEIEDLTFRVVIEGNYAKAASTGSAFWAPVGARYYSLAKRAIEQASGCLVVENNSYRATVYATLDCSAKPTTGG